MDERADALFLPSDTPISEIEVKRGLLFFDSVTLPNPADYALVNEGEISEEFPDGMRFIWSARNNFPRSPDYQDVMLDLLSNSLEVQKKGMLRVTPDRPLPYLNSGMNWALWHSAITDISLVEAAAPDRFDSEIPVLFKPVYFRGGGISLNGYTSKYEIQETRPAAMFSDVNEYWSHYAHLRIGRFLKFLRLSHGMNLIPVATDKPNQKMLASVSNTEDIFTDSVSCHENYIDLPNLALELDVFDVEALNDALHAMNWREVIRLRKEILPGMQSLRADLNKIMKLQRNESLNNRDEHKKRLETLLKDYHDKREKLAEEWEKLRIAAITKLCGGVGGLAFLDKSGLIAVTTGAPIIDLLTKLFAAGLLGAAALSGELKNLLPAQRKVKKHSLYFIEKFPTK